ncbi:MAG: GIY-YIG nuclease family protein [Bacteroidales bacterium]|nr:GIY-YIG nuclease family protein [Bacteroidales bacterium]
MKDKYDKAFKILVIVEILLGGMIFLSITTALDNGEFVNLPAFIVIVVLAVSVFIGSVITYLIPIQQLKQQHELNKQREIQQLKQQHELNEKNKITYTELQNYNIIGEIETNTVRCKNFNITTCQRYIANKNDNLGIQTIVEIQNVISNFKDGDYINKGDVVYEIHMLFHLSKFCLKLKKQMSIKITATESGFYESLINKTNIIYNSIFSTFSDKPNNVILFAIYPDDATYINETTNIEHLVEIDSFTKEKTITIKESFDRPTDLSKFLPEDTYSLFKSNLSNSFGSNIPITTGLWFSVKNINSKDYLVVGYDQSEIDIHKNDTISFLFENAEIASFVLNTLKINIGYNLRQFEVSLCIEHLELLKNNNLLQTRVDNKKENFHSDYELNKTFQHVIRRLFNLYHNSVQNEIDNYQPLKKIDISNSIDTDNESNCYVYLMIDIINNYHKIGISNSPKYREKTLQSEKPTIELICTKKFPNRKIAQSFEKALHDAYSDKRIRGEWFSLDQREVEDIIKSFS